MSFFPRLDLPVRSTCYHGGRTHENGYGYVDDSVVDRLLEEEEVRLNQYFETLRYTSAPQPLGWKYRSSVLNDGSTTCYGQAARGSVTQSNEAYADVVNEDEEEEEELIETQDDELVLDDDDDDELDEDMEMDEDETDHLHPTPTPVDQRRGSPHGGGGGGVEAGGHVHGPIQTVNLTSFLESPIDAAFVRPPQRFSVGSYDNGGGSSARQRRRFSLPRTDRPTTFSDSRRSSIMSTGSSVEYNRQTPTRRFSFSSPSIIGTPSTPANDTTDDSTVPPQPPSDVSNPLAWDFLSLR
ncbi:hypothetical protein H257_02997 [Aphanomyces astaci]|uniref:Uncharacterized protein n=1 Tax=Aphanomyces astaci TaxID=112090 RepID=W4GZT4_APHAT|nr:hypothetical protein H257_02997 [Aphanomyces astaci]ETV85157.1 hypothetical protein H257_02997 [Aphanomyces astaci]RQM21190.1 hypothetical protein B5M09_005660 [Aphanomyces astaci]|eukprot:XP_009825175.1 hypothetical protein H257_02997 [Aphanomyces astaci]